MQKAGRKFIFLVFSSNPVVLLGLIDGMSDMSGKQIRYLPPAVPKLVSSRLALIDGNPIAWWVGQCVKYLLQMQPKTQDYINKIKEKIQFQRPIVG